jgi:hypothetical protein
MDGTSRVTGDGQARFCEGLGGKFPGATRPGASMLIRSWTSRDRSVRSADTEEFDWTRSIVEATFPNPCVV